MNSSTLSALDCAEPVATTGLFNQPSNTAIQLREKFPAVRPGSGTAVVPVNKRGGTAEIHLEDSVARGQATNTDVLAEWSGCVTEVQESGTFFSATLMGIKGEGVKGEEEDANIPISDVSAWDKDLLAKGNFFRLCVVHEIDHIGQPRRFTQVVFRRLPAYRQSDLDKAEERGRELARGLRVE